jgi:lysophospholipase-2
MTTAWYTPTSFSPIPVGRSSSSPYEEEEEDDNTPEILASVEYLSSLIDEEVKRGVKPERIVIGGFSQGCAISLLTALNSCSRWKDRVAGVVGLSGYLPRINSNKKEEEGKEDGKRDKSKTEIFLAHGTRDMLIPMRVFRDTKARVLGLVREERVEVKVYEGLGHVTRGDEFRDLCAFLERVVPA